MAGYEHALFLLLLLGYLLRDLSGMHRDSLFLIACCFILIYIPPFIKIAIPWNVVLALVLPWIFWHNAWGWLFNKFHVVKREIALWLTTSFCLILVAIFIGGYPWMLAIFFGIIVSSMLWLIASRDGNPSLLGSIAPLALVFLLVETSLSLYTPRQHAESLFSGASLGIAFALLSIGVLRKVGSKYESLISLIQVYLAYWTALMIGISAIAASLISIMVYIEFHEQRSEFKGSRQGSFFLDTRVDFYIALTLFGFIAWQTHQQLIISQWLEIGLGLIVGLVVTMLGWKNGLPQFASLKENWYTTIYLVLFIMGLLILWPREPEIGAMQLWIALGSAVIMPILSELLLNAMHMLSVHRD